MGKQAEFQNKNLYSYEINFLADAEKLTLEKVIELYGENENTSIEIFITGYNSTGEMLQFSQTYKAKQILAGEFSVLKKKDFQFRWYRKFQKCPFTIKKLKKKLSAFQK